MGGRLADLGGRGAVFLAEDDEGVVGPCGCGCRVATSGTSRPPTSGLVRPQRRGAEAAARVGGRGGACARVVARDPRRAGREPAGGRRLAAARLRVREAHDGGPARRARGAARRRASARAPARSTSRPTTRRRSSRPSRSSCRGSATRDDDGRAAGKRVDPRRRRARPTATRRRTAGLRERSRSRSARSSLTLAIEEGAVVRYVIYERGGMADEYPSVPEYFGPLPPGDVLALGANPTVAQRLTGADPEQRPRGRAHGRDAGRAAAAGELLAAARRLPSG